MTATVKLTPARRRALEVVATCTEVVTSNRTDASVPCITIVTADALQQGGLITLGDWNGRTHICRITDTGRAALEEGT